MQESMYSFSKFPAMLPSLWKCWISYIMMGQLHLRSFLRTWKASHREPKSYWHSDFPFLWFTLLAVIRRCTTIWRWRRQRDDLIYEFARGNGIEYTLLIFLIFNKFVVVCCYTLFISFSSGRPNGKLCLSFKAIFLRWTNAIQLRKV